MKRQRPDRYGGSYSVVGHADPEVPDTDWDVDWDVWDERQATIREAEKEVSRGRRPDLTVVCVPNAGCGADGKSGEALAGVYLTAAGALWCSEPVVAHDALPSFAEMYPDAVVMRHPATRGVTESTREAFEKVWQPEGWQEATRAELSAKQRWRPQRALQVRDLVNREDLPHVTLRVTCSRHGAAMVDRALLLSEVPKYRTGTARVVPLPALCRVVE